MPIHTKLTLIYKYIVKEMGLLSEGTPLYYKDIKENADHVRRHGIKQFINLYKKSKDRQNDEFRWGDEVR